MGVISSANTIAGTLGPYRNAGAPSAGTSAVFTLTIGGTPSGGTFRLQRGARPTEPITWSSTNATLIANIDAALEALIGAGNVTTAAGTLTAGIGTVTLTLTGDLARLAGVSLGVFSNSLTGTSPTLAMEETTPGVTATGRGVEKGGELLDTTNGKHYTNTGTKAAPTWTVTGTQS